METSESHVAELLTSTDTAPCGCKARTITPDPPKIPMEPLPENLEKLRNYIVEHYSSSTMNMCSHQSLPEMAGPPLHFTLKEGTVPKVGSRFTSPAEANYVPVEGELLGVVNDLHKTKYFTLGCPHLFVGTDHKPLLGILNVSPVEKLDNPRLVRLKEKTAGWNYKIIYVPGRKLGGTDALSRYGVTH